MKRIAEREVLKSKLFTIKDLDMQLEDNTQVTYQIMEKGDTALIVPLDAVGNMLLIEEYFAAIDAYQYAFPKGRIDAGENALEAANRELQEEVGYKAGKIEKIATLTMSPGYLTQKTHIYLASELTESKLEGDEFEALRIVRHPLKDFQQLIDNGKINEARMISAMYLAVRKLGLITM